MQKILLNVSYRDLTKSYLHKISQRRVQQFMGERVDFCGTNKIYLYQLLITDMLSEHYELNYLCNISGNNLSIYRRISVLSNYL